MLKHSGFTVFLCGDCSAMHIAPSAMFESVPELRDKERVAEINYGELHHERVVQYFLEADVEGASDFVTGVFAERNRKVKHFDGIDPVTSAELVSNLNATVTATPDMKASVNAEGTISGFGINKDFIVSDTITQEPLAVRTPPSYMETKELLKWYQAEAVRVQATIMAGEYNLHIKLQ